MTFLRRAAEITLGPWVVRRRLPAAAGGGVVVASARVAGLRYLLKPSNKWDPELLEAARWLVEPGAVVWDIGSNVGLFAKAAAFHAGPDGHVVAVEADNDAVALLLRGSRLDPRGHAPMTVVPVGVGASTGFVRFAIAKRARSANAIEGFGGTQTGGVSEIRTVPGTTLDAMLDHFPKPSVLKIDVEGAESAVLAGASRLLREVRPAIHCEVSSENASRVSNMFRATGYALFDAATLARGVKVEREDATWNTVAVPAERRTAFLARALPAAT